MLEYKISKNRLYDSDQSFGKRLSVGQAFPPALGSWPRHLGQDLGCIAKAADPQLNWERVPFIIEAGLSGAFPDIVKNEETNNLGLE